MDDLRYPIGRFQVDKEVDAQKLQCWIEDLSNFPGQLKELLEGLDQEKLDTPYRPGGWTVRQVVHHLADSHINAYTRFRFALTEEQPSIKTYDEAAWAELSDARLAPVESSLRLLEALHDRWVALLRSLDQTKFDRTFLHPEWGAIKLSMTTQLYAWHSRHHLAHIAGLKERMGWL